ncbi:hypothetical protein [Sphaerimonospora thailandensis]|uniref:Uncharacterized protein n=1 Tax=Sphaerimonospora thailandensis TaxID=795644 RepID=A0A8J3RDR4_9ACTN|nr:hypothetical protein [Sphaerimonospora thailandensis]GIH72795.1 hypothetical protein Mth01_50480 [Sphaerimonospora thailandensis]
MLVCTAAASLIAVLLAGPPPGPAVQEPARTAGPIAAGATPLTGNGVPFGNRAPNGSGAPNGNGAPMGNRIPAGNMPKSEQPKARHIVQVGKDGVPKEIFVVPLPIDASGMPTAPVAIPNFGFQNFQTTAAPPRHKKGRRTAPQWRDRNWDRAWERRREQDGKRAEHEKRHGKRAEHEKRHSKRAKHEKRAHGKRAERVEHGRHGRHGKRDRPHRGRAARHRR